MKTKREIDGRQVFTICLIAFAVIVWTFFIFIPYLKGKAYFKDLEYTIVVEQIEIRSGNRGIPHIYSNNEWRLLYDGEWKIADYIQPGDSIVKIKGNKKVTVYRHNQDNQLSKKEFD